MDNIRKNTRLLRDAVIIMILGIIGVFLYINISNTYSSMNESIVEGDANKYLDAIALYCISDDSNTICNLQENSDSICISDTENPFNVSLDFRKIVPEQYSPKYKKAYIESVKNPFTNKLEYKITFIEDNYESAYSKPIQEAANNITRYVYNGNSSITGSENVILTGEDFGDFSITKDFSTTSKNIFMQSVDINTSKSINDLSNTTFTFENVILDDCIVSGLNISQETKNIVLSSNTVCLGDNNGIKGDSNIVLDEVNNIVLQDNSYILANNLEDSSVYLNNMFTNFSNNTNINLVYLNEENSGNLKVLGTNTLTNIVISDNAILDLDCASDLKITASGNSVTIIEVADDKIVDIESIKDNACIVTNKKLLPIYDKYFSKVIYSKNDYVTEWYLYLNK